MKVLILSLIVIHGFAQKADTLSLDPNSFDSSQRTPIQEDDIAQFISSSGENSGSESQGGTQNQTQELTRSGDHTGTVQNLDPLFDDIKITIIGGSMNNIFICREFAQSGQSIPATCNASNKAAFTSVAASSESPAWENHPDQANAIRFKPGSSFSSIYGAEVSGGHMKIYFSKNDPNSTTEQDFNFISAADISFATVNSGTTPPPTTSPPTTTPPTGGTPSGRNPYCEAVLCVSPSFSNGIHCGCNGFARSAYKQPFLEAAGKGGPQNETIWIRGRDLGRFQDGRYGKGINIAILSCASEQVIGFYIHDKQARESASDPTKDSVQHTLSGVHLDEFKQNGIKVKVLVPGGGTNPSLETNVSNCVQYSAP